MSSRRQSDGKARLLLALLTLTGIGLQAVPFLLIPPATLELLLHDKVFDSSFAGKEARVVYGGEEGEAGTSIQILEDPAGYIARLPRIPSGPGNVAVRVDGYQPASLDIRPEPLAVLRADVALVPTFGRVEVTTVDARNANRPVPARLTVAGREVEAQPNAVSVFDLPPGVHPLKARAEGFCPAEGRTTAKERQVTKVRLPISPRVGGDQVARFVLDWGESPRDLDAHLNLTESTVGLAAPHVYYVNMRGVTAAGAVFATLDVDHVNSEGFETVTVYHRVPGIYQYFVHRFSGDGALNSSSATVALITKGCEIQRFNVPADCTERWWHVVDLEVTQQGVRSIPRGECVASPGKSWGRRRK